MRLVVLRFLSLLCVISGLVALPAVALAVDAPQAPKTAWSLSDFGPLTTATEVQQAYEKAVAALRDSGGILLVPGQVHPQIRHETLQGLVRTPEPPAETKQWHDGGGVTVITSDAKQAIVEVPPLTGMRIERTLHLQPGDSLPHWGTHPVVTIDSKLQYGSNSYLDWIQAPVAKGPDRKFYVPSIRGIRPGQFLNVHGGPGYGGGVTRACVKSIGYDAERQMHYFVADTDIDHVAGAIAHNKNNTGILHMLQTSNNDNQTYDVKVIRNQYAHGDTYIYYCDFNYMSNVHSAAGDENGNCYGAFIRSLDNNFRGAVEAIDWQQNQLKFAASAQNVATLGDSRPLVNRNPKKAITQGKVRIVPAQCYWDTTDTDSCRFGGQSYPTRLVKNPVTGVSELKMGGLIVVGGDCPWGPEVVGRYFAVDEPTEKTPKGNLRWYEITALRPREDGTKEIEIRRYWWGAKSAGSPTLYRHDNYSWDDHDRPLSYVIAPGTYVNDVSGALVADNRPSQRTLGIVPFGDQGTSFDFEPGDTVEQAIGPDPFKPQAFRVWMWEDVPGAFPSAVFDIANHGAASRYSVLTVAGGGTTLEQAAQRQEQKPAWDNVLVLNAAAGVGINCQADFADAAILFKQPNHEQPIKWYYGQAEGAKPQEAVLTVTKSSGEFNFQGGGIRAGGPISAVRGLSGDDEPAQNLRGKNIPVGANAKSIDITFPQPEADGDYAVFIEQSWLTNRAVSKKIPDGFTITFGEPAPDGATVDWMIVR